MGKKKDKVVDLKPEKISDAHLTQLQSIVNKINELQFKLGGAEVQKHAMLHDLAVMQDGAANMQELLVREYGTYDVNVQDGTINYSDGSSNS